MFPLFQGRLSNPTFRHWPTHLMLRLLILHHPRRCLNHKLLSYRCLRPRPHLIRPTPHNVLSRNRLSSHPRKDSTRDVTLDGLFRRRWFCCRSCSRILQTAAHKISVLRSGDILLMILRGAAFHAVLLGSRGFCGGGCGCRMDLSGAKNGRNDNYDDASFHV